MDNVAADTLLQALLSRSNVAWSTLHVNTLVLIIVNVPLVAVGIYTGE